jgi:hypothetical protein
LKNTIFWVLAPCSSEKARLFGRRHRLHLQGRRAGQARNQQKAGDKFLRNVKLSLNYRVLQVRRAQSSVTTAKTSNPTGKLYGGAPSTPKKKCSIRVLR